MYEIETNEFISEKNRSLEYAEKINGYKCEIQLIVEELVSINMEEISQSLSVIEGAMENEASHIRVLSETMARIEECYSNTEDDVIDNLRSMGNLNGKRYGIGYFTTYRDKGIDSQLMSELIEMIQ
ncbi:hypothetical protein SAMN02910292_02594 [Lachnospiraceae bacterium XBB2008]|nr:hypothetical protein SAMN02910292_02594 [Lachnospiraceae bacterium XBB2008]